MERPTADPALILGAWLLQTINVSVSPRCILFHRAPKNVYLATLTESWLDSSVRTP